MQSQIQSNHLIVQNFYQKIGFKRKINPNDYILLAKEKNNIIGVIRICEEGQFLVLREMFDGNSFRRQTNTTEMQKELEEQLQGRESFCIPNTSLKKYYKQLGYMPVELDKAPLFFNNELRSKKRMEKFSHEKKSRIIMKKLKL